MTRANLEEMQRKNSVKTITSRQASQAPLVTDESLDSDCSIRPTNSTPHLCVGCLEMIKTVHHRRLASKKEKCVKVILNGITSYFNAGNLVAIMGPSGSGKTTFMDLITGRKENSNVSVCMTKNKNC